MAGGPPGVGGFGGGFAGGGLPPRPYGGGPVAVPPPKRGRRALVTLGAVVLLAAAIAGAAVVVTNNQRDEAGGGGDAAAKVGSSSTTVAKPTARDLYLAAVRKNEARQRDLAGFCERPRALADQRGYAAGDTAQWALVDATGPDAYGEVQEVSLGPVTQLTSPLDHFRDISLAVCISSGTPVETGRMCQYQPLDQFGMATGGGPVEQQRLVLATEVIDVYEVRTGGHVGGGTVQARAGNCPARSQLGQETIKAPLDASQRRDWLVAHLDGGRIH